MAVLSAENGVYNFDYLNDVVKEFGIRIGDGSKSTDDAMAGMLGSTQELFDKFQGGEATVADMAKAIAADLSTLENDVDRNAMGVALFGTKWEDLGGDVVLSMLTAGESLGDFEGAMAKMNEVRFDTVNAAIRGIGRTLLIDLVMPIGDAVLPYLNQFANFLQNNLPNAIEKAKSTFVTVVPAILGVVSAIVVYKGTLATVVAAQKVFNAVQKISIVLYNAHRAAMIAYALYGGGLQGIIRGMAAAQQVLNVTMLANPFVLVAAAVIGLGVAFVAAYKMSDAFREKVNNAFASVKNFVTNSANYIASNSATMWNGLIESAKALPAKLSAALSGSAIGKMVSGLFGDGKGIMDGLINSIKAGFSSLPGIISMVAPIMTTLGLSLLGVSGPIGWLIGAIVSIGGFLFRLAQTNDGVAAGLSSAWQSVVTAFAPIIDVLKQGFTDFASEVGPQLQKTMTMMAESISALAPSFAALGGTLAELGMLLMSVWAEVGTTLATNVLPLILQAFQTVFPLVLSIISTVIPIVIGLITSIIPIILQLAQMIIPLILSVVQMVFPLVLSIIQSVLPIVATLITTVVGVILTLAQTVLPLVLSVVQMVFPIVLSVIQTIIPIITMVLQTLVTIINGVIVPAINGILAVVQLVFPYVQMIIQNALAIVNGLITAAMALLRGDWDGAWNAILSTATTIMNNIISFFSGINLFEVGRTIINGLINGIASMGSAVVTAISGMIPEPIRGAASKLLGALPGFAKGGVVASPTLAWVGEGGDTESIIPWNNSQRSKDLWMQTGHALGMMPEANEMAHPTLAPDVLPIAQKAQAIQQNPVAPMMQTQAQQISNITQNEYITTPTIEMMPEIFVNSELPAMQAQAQQISNSNTYNDYSYLASQKNDEPVIDYGQMAKSTPGQSQPSIVVQYSPQYNVQNPQDLQQVQKHAENDKVDLEARIAELTRNERRVSFG